MHDNQALFDQLKNLTTEQRNIRSSSIDSLSVTAILKIISREDRIVPIAVGWEISSIAKAVELIVASFRNGGRLLYVGAGTSGRLGILDAAECPPTYGTDPKMIQGIIAGGKKAVFRTQEGAEDKAGDGARQIRAKHVSSRDVVCGIAASLRTPFVAAAIREAKRRGAKTLYVTTNPRDVLRRTSFADLRKSIDVAICIDVRPEVIMGSTRMKAGTAQKLVLNMLTTASMIRLGKVYENMMIDLKMTSRKLEERAKRILMIATGADYDTAASTLRAARGHVKTAIVMIKTNVSAEKAQARLERAQGFVRLAIANKKRSR
ncbi:MAG: N-acetylmuramic acid 6-phosphate etherase [Ignavibacteriae bacterium]|nr:N-acetylmuramic acid 6-phosphate etherase [Ignavibacteria bacterium]MBI3365362.1 N-acetylmuramic acid 6-phosphate etherase [Ignavibacteriota bacterium]